MYFCIEVSRLVTVPLAVQLHTLSVTLKHKQQEVDKLRQKVADLTPDIGGRPTEQLDGGMQVNQIMIVI